MSVVNRDDEPVTDLQASDFIVTEDELPQTVETAQFVRLDGQRRVDNGESLEIRGPSQAAVEATKEDVRLFAIFLDDYHIDRHPSITIPLRKALEGFIEQLQPTDLVVIMDPLDDARRAALHAQSRPICSSGSAPSKDVAASCSRCEARWRKRR